MLVAINSKEHIKEVCKAGQGSDCCRFLMMHPDHGMACAKNDAQWSNFFNAKVELNEMKAKGDNCEGLKDS